MTKIDAQMATAICDGVLFNVIMLTHHGIYDFYLEPADGSSFLESMFGLPIDQQSAEEAMDIALGNVPDYVDLFDE